VVSIGERKPYPLQVEQVVRSDAEKREIAQKKRRKASKKSSKPKGKPGRPKGCKNKDKRQIEWTPELSRVARMAAVLLKRMGPLCAIRYFILDGHFGNSNVMQMVRFQIEFNFRDAKQFWGFEDFMNVNQAPVTNAVGLAFFMVNLSAWLIQHFRPDIPNFGILDLKAHFRSRRFISEALKLLPTSVDTVLLHDLLDRISPLGAIHSHKNASLAP
jgi:hypothetical protein